VGQCPSRQSLAAWALLFFMSSPRSVRECVSRLRCSSGPDLMSLASFEETALNRPLFHLHKEFCINWERLPSPRQSLNLAYGLFGRSITSSSVHILDSLFKKTTGFLESFPQLALAGTLPTVLRSGNRCWVVPQRYITV
jgi:hypothetical protein